MTVGTTDSSNSASKMPGMLDHEQKLRYKKSLAKMMVYWIINTRHDWLDRLLKQDFKSWRDNLPYLASAFASDPAEFDDFLVRACHTIEGPFMTLAMQIVNKASMDDWVQMGIDPFCPADEAIDLMYKAFADRVDNLPEANQ